MRQKLSIFSQSIICLLLDFFLLMLSFFCIHRNISRILLFLSVLLLFVSFLFILSKFLQKTPSTKRLFILCILCFCLKLLGISFFHPTPVADYNTYFTFGKALSESYTITNNPLYIALFPHVFGYSHFLSIIFKITGVNTWSPVFINVILSVVSMIFIYYIALDFGGSRSGIYSALLWVFLPSQTLWNNFILSEPLYTTLLLAIWYLCSVQCRTQNTPRSFILAITIGILLGYFNALRPIAIIIIISILLWKIFISKDKHLGNLLITLLIYFLFTTLTTQYIESRINYDTDSFNWYSVSVGFNEASNGAWNEDDWSLLLNSCNQFNRNGSKTPIKDAQVILKSQALWKISHLKHPVLFFLSKLNILAGSDSSAVSHLVASEVALSDFSYQFLTVLCDSFYLLILLLGFFGMLFLAKSLKDNILFCIVPLYAIGLIMAHMLVAVQGRYHYSILPAIILFAGYGAEQIIKHFSKQPTS